MRFLLGFENLRVVRPTDADPRIYAYVDKVTTSFFWLGKRRTTVLVYRKSNEYAWRYGSGAKMDCYTQGYFIEALYNDWLHSEKAYAELIGLNGESAP